MSYGSLLVPFPYTESFFSLFSGRNFTHKTVDTTLKTYTLHIYILQYEKLSSFSPGTIEFYCATTSISYLYFQLQTLLCVR